MLNFQINADAPRLPLPHYWETCVGSCHAYTALRADYREQLRRVHRDAGFRYIRFHGLLNDDMSVVCRNESGKPVYNFFNIDCIVDFLLDIGMKPFFELSFMPEALASGTQTCFHYKGNITRPKDYAEWDALITRLASHLEERYGAAEVRSWFFEVWNEPNLQFFYHGTQADYFELYSHTARAVKSVDPLLAVGGPATACNAWISDLIGYCEASGAPLDFVSTHHYPTDDPLWEKGASLGVSSSERLYSRGVLTAMMKAVKAEAKDYPLYYTERNSSARVSDEVHDLPYSAAFAVKTIIDNLGMAEAYSFWTFTDIFEEAGQIPGEFFGGFGLQTVHGVPKATYRAFEFLHSLGGDRLAATGEQETVGLIASEAHGEIRAVAYNCNMPGEPVKAQRVRISVSHRRLAHAEISLIDETHANSYGCWKHMGSPEYPNAKQLDELFAASRTVPEVLPAENSETGGAVEFILPPDAVASVSLR